MTKENDPYFRNTRNPRYPRVGAFLITEPSGEKHGVTLWHNRVDEDSSNPTRFFEESSIFNGRGVYRMDIDSYNTYLSELDIPPRLESGYEVEQVLYVASLDHRIIVEHASPDVSQPQGQRRIRRQVQGYNGEQVVHNYRTLIARFDDDRIIVPEDFSHWKPHPPGGARKELTTRFNAPIQ